MHSVPVTIAWESFRRGFWLWIASILGMLSVMSALFGTLRFQGLVDLDDPALKRFHLTLVVFMMFMFGMVTIVDLDSWRRHFLLPLPTSSLVACRMFPGMLVSAIQVAFVVTVLNVAMNLNWPVWRPALFAAMISASVQATIWFAEKSALMVLILAAIGGVIGTWFYFGVTWISHPSADEWRILTNFDVAGTIVFTGVSFVFGVAGVSRNRRGEQLKPLGFEVWINGLIEINSSDMSRFRSPAEAQSWFMWTRKGWLLPGIMILAEVFAMMCWLIFSREPKELIGGFVAGGAVLSMMGIIGGLVFGNMGPTDTNSEIGSFLASRPLTSKEMARTTILALAKSVLIAWLIWAVSFVAVIALLHITGDNPSQLPPAAIEWWYPPAALLACWTTASFFSAICLAGRQNLVAKVLSIILILGIGLVSASACTLSRDTQLQLYLGTVAAAGIGCVITSIGLMIVAYRRNLIEFAHALISIGIWIALTTIVIIEWERHPVGPFSYYILAVGVAALSVAPSASAPLALSWNRHR